MQESHATSSIETNLSRVFLTPDRVFKLLKAVELPFVDHRDTETRCAAVTKELDVNRAISPSVYLDAVDLCDASGALDDRMLVMRRLDDDDALSRPRAPQALAEALRRTARRIATLHANQPALSGDDASAASCERVAENWADNVRVLERHRDHLVPGAELDEVARLARDYVTGRHALFEAREAAGWVRDGHGDLRCEHVFVEADEVQLIDALAFSDDYRVADVLNDVAFLAMDLDRLFGTDASVTLMQHWGDFTNEHHPSSLAHFFVAYRAQVRAKVACLAYESGDALAAAAVRTHHDLALRHLRLARPRLVLVGGGPGTGKSTIADGLARRIGAAWLRADEIRKDLAGIGHDEHAFAAPGEGIYSADMNARMHDEIARQAALLLAHGENVVLDATWSSAESRRLLRDVASQASAEVDELRCIAPNPICRERIARRMAMVHNPSDASPELVDHMADRFDDWPQARVIDTNRPLAESLDEAVDAVLGRPSNTSPRRVERFFLDVPAVRRLSGIWLMHEGLAPIAGDVIDARIGSQIGTKGPAAEAQTGAR